MFKDRTKESQELETLPPSGEASQGEDEVWEADEGRGEVKVVGGGCIRYLS